VCLLKRNWTKSAGLGWATLGHYVHLILPHMTEKVYRRTPYGRRGGERPQKNFIND